MDRQVLVDLRPMNSEASTGDLPLIALSVRRVQQTRIPSQWHADRSAVCEIYHERVCGDAYSQNPFAWFTFQSAHSTLRSVSVGSRVRSSRWCATRVPESRSSRREPLGSAKTLPTNRRDRHEHAAVRPVHGCKSTPDTAHRAKQSARSRKLSRAPLTKPSEMTSRESGHDENLRSVEEARSQPSSGRGERDTGQRLRSLTCRAANFGACRHYFLTIVSVVLTKGRRSHG